MFPVIDIKRIQHFPAIPGGPPFGQWPFQEPKLEVLTIYKAYVREYPQNMALYGTVPPF